MSFDKETYLLLLQESKQALAPFKVTRSDLASILNRQRITDELIYELIETAKEEGVIFAQTENDFILLTKFYQCDFARVERVKFSEEEYEDIENDARLKSQQLLNEIELESSLKEIDLESSLEEYEYDPLIDKLDVIFSAINKIVNKAEDESMKQLLSRVEKELTFEALYIRNEYNEFINSNELDSDDLESSLDEFHHSDPFYHTLEQELLYSLNPNYSDTEEPPVNAYYLAMLPIFQRLNETLADVREKYMLKRDYRKGEYSDQR